MRMHFLVTTNLNLYVEDSETGLPAYGTHRMGLNRRAIANISEGQRKCHLMTVDKKYAEMYLGDVIESDQNANPDELKAKFG